MSRKTRQHELELPFRSVRRTRAAVRRTRRAAGLPPDTLAERTGATLRRLAGSQGVRLGGLWSAALAVGVAGGVWLGLERPQGADDRVSQALRAQLTVARLGPPAPEIALPAQTQPPAEPEDAPLAEAGDGPTPSRALAVAARAAAAEIPYAPAAVAEPAAPAPPPLRLVSLPVPASPETDDGAEPAWQVNAVPVALTPDDRPMIAVVIDDLGLKRGATRQTVALPGPLSLSFLAYAEDLPAQMTAGRAAGHELLLHTPMEPLGDQDPGPNALMAELPAAENLRRLAAALEAAPGIVGINNHMGSRFTASAEALRPVMAELQRRGLLFVDSRTTAQSLAQQVATRMGVPSVARDVFLDHDVEAGRPYVEARLAQVEAVARSHGMAVAIGHPHVDTLAALRVWLPQLAAKGFQLVPVSAVVRARMVRQLAAAEAGQPLSTSERGLKGLRW